MTDAMAIDPVEKAPTPPPVDEKPPVVAAEEEPAAVEAPAETSTPEVTETSEAPAITAPPTSDEPVADNKPEDALIDGHSKEEAVEKPEEKEQEQESAEDIEMSDHVYSDDDEESEYEPEAETTPKAKTKAPKAPKTPATTSKLPKTPKAPKTPKTPLSRVRTGRIDKSSSPAQQSTLECPVEGCDQKFIGRNPRQSLWHHLKYYATRGLPDKAEFERKHGEAHAAMKRDAEPKGTPVERNRISSSDYRKKNPEKAKTSARLSNFRARARKKGLTDEQEIEEAVSKWEKEWQEKQAKEASEYFSGILLSAFE